MSLSNIIKYTAGAVALGAAAYAGYKIYKNLSTNPTPAKVQEVEPQPQPQPESESAETSADEDVEEVKSLLFKLYGLESEEEWKNFLQAIRDDELETVPIQEI